MKRDAWNQQTTVKYLLLTTKSSQLMFKIMKKKRLGWLFSVFSGMQQLQTDLLKTCKNVSMISKSGRSIIVPVSKFSSNTMKS